jgi:RNA polymerase sigma-70 factor (ECF subfamily)
VRRRDFERLIHDHAPAVSAYARAICSDPWIADDAVQETFARAWKYLDSYAAHGSFEGWLIRICRHCTIDLTSRLSTTSLAIDEHDVPEPPDCSVELQMLVGRLPLSQREVVVLCGVLGYDYQGAADLLGVPVGTIRSRLSRARNTLDAMLANDETAAG